MKIKSLVIYIALVLVACNSKSKKSSTLSENMEIKEKDSVLNMLENEFIFEEELLVGIWAENDFDNALFEITKDSIRYLENYETPYLIDLKGDKIYFILEKYISESKVLKLTSDSLVLKSQENDIIKLVKR